MNKLIRFEAWAKKTYKPKEATWKRPTLFIISLVMGIACCISAYLQINYDWTNNGIWLAIGLFSFLSLLGLVVSIKCKDFWVALVFGRI